MIPRRYVAGWAEACLLVFLGCSGDPNEAAGPVDASLMVRANVSSQAVASVVVEVTGPGINPPLVFNIAIVNGIAQGIIRVPAGSDRTITMSAYDAGGVMTHQGSVTLDVHGGNNVTISIVLTPVAGDIPIDVTLGTVVITVIPALDTLDVGQTVTLKARIVDSNGQAVNAPVAWATANPGVAIVTSTSDSTGLVTAEGVGETTIVATYSGIAGAATVVVVPALQQVASVARALYLTAPRGDQQRLFVVSQLGRIYVINNGTLLSTPFLDVSALVSTAEGEQGLLSMAFHPDYAQNGFFYVSYTDLQGDSQIVRYTVSTDHNVANPASAFQILFVDQPYHNHNGGLVTFGPDGMLYIGLGDGGGFGDPDGNGQDSTTLLGAILRIDVDGGSPYAIPPDNPFAGHASARPEIWAYGLRNPWRFSFDRLTGNLYIADVGQGSREEVNVQLASNGGGENYGWNRMEGSICYQQGCSPAGLTLPVLDYTHAEGCSITGGYVYRGSDIPGLGGHYFYGDYCQGWVRSFRYSGGVVTEQRDYRGAFGIPGNITSFGEDARGELYVVTSTAVFRIVPSLS